MKASGKQVLYRETQRFTQLWLWLVVFAVAALVWYGFVKQIVFGVPFGSKPASDPELWASWLLVGVVVPLLFRVMKLDVEVSDRDLMIRFYPFRTRRIPLSSIKHCEPCVYQPLFEYGGWGIRWSPVSGWAYNVSGNQGVRLTLADGSRLLIGSQRPGALAEAIRQGRAGKD